MVRDAPRTAIPAAAVYDSADFLLHQPGLAQKRGGTSYAGPALTGATYAAAAAYAEFPSGSKVIAIGDNGNLFVVTPTITTDVGDLGTGFPPIDKPKLRVDKLIIPAADGTTSPQKFDGAAISALGGSPPAGKHVDIYKTRVVIGGNAANPSRLFFSPTPDIEATWDVANSYMDMDFAVTGIANFQNLLLVFSEGHLERLLGTTPPPGTDFDKAVVANVGCTDARSIVAETNSVVFANTGGVYQFTGGQPQSLTAEGGIEAYWQSLFVGYSRSTWSIAAGRFRSFYLVSVMNGSTLVATLMCNIPRKAWWRLKNIKSVMYAQAVGVAEELYYADRSTNRLTSISGTFSPTAANKNDADGTPVEPLIETRMLGRGPGLKHFRDGFLSYNLRDVDADNPTLAVSIAPGLEAPAFAPTPESPLGENSAVDRLRFTVAEIAQGVSVRLQQTGPSSETELYALEVEERALSPVGAGSSG